MIRVEKYADFLKEGIEDIFKSAHGALDVKQLKPLKNFIGRPKFPTEEEFQEAVKFLRADPDCFFYNSGDFLHPIIYWKDFLFYGFFGGLRMDVLKMTQADKFFQQMRDFQEEMIAKKNYESLFSRADKKILIPTFVKLYDEIPNDQKYDIFTSLYVRSEYGFQMFPMEIIKDCFSKRKLSNDWKERMREFSEEVKPGEDGKITLYRGQNTGSAQGDDAFSWTTSRKTAKFFADRFSKGSGKIVTKKIDPSEAIDYLQDRGESEVILSPKKFGTLTESLNEATAEDVTVNIYSGAMYPVRIILASKRNKVMPHVTVRFAHPNMGSTIWFELDENGKIDIKTTSTESDIVEKFAEIFNTWTRFYTKGAIELQGDDAEKFLKESPLFGKWWKKGIQKYRGTISGKKYGI
jgi:hypothetical protein